MLKSKFLFMNLSSALLLFVSAIASAAPLMLSPNPGNTLTASSVPFSWSANGTPVTKWALFAGSSKGAQNYFRSKNLGSATSLTVAGLPTNGSTVYIRLYYYTDSWKPIDYTYATSSGSAPTNEPAITWPLPGSSLSNSTETFSWSANSAPVTRWALYAGSTKGAKDYYRSYRLGSATTLTIPGLPTDGSTVHIRLSYNINDTWLKRDFTYTASQKNREDAFRFLNRSTFGPTFSSIDNLLSLGYENWLEEQFAEPANYQDPKLVEALTEFGWQNIYNSYYSRQRRVLRMDQWWDTVVNDKDQLRQRIAFALSQIFVISENDQSIFYRTRGLANYYDILIKQAFGNFRDLLGEVTLNPMMGNYLGVRRNEKANLEGTIHPDENYAREVMQLFTIGLDELNINGTKKLVNNKPVPTYTQTDVLNFARVFTGWNYGNAHKMRTEFRPNVGSELIPMRAFEEFHDTDEKTLLRGVVLPAGQTARQDLDMALDNLFYHPNVGPFLSKQLIQRLVTSNPSNAYVGRVARIFNHNNQGVRGDMKAVVRAILMDPEAINGHRDSPETFGKIKEPLIMISQLWRAYNAQGINGKLRHYHSLAELGQENLNAPSVFNFYSPSYRPQGEIANRGLVSPELQIFNDAVSIYTHNRLRILAFQREQNSSLDNDRWSNNHSILLNLDTEIALANNPTALIRRYSNVLFGGNMPENMKTTLVNFIEKTHLRDGGIARAKETLFLIISSPEYAYQR